MGKKPKLEICEYKYCDGNHEISKCDETKCDGTHTKLRKVKNGKHGPNPYLKYALSNSMGRRFAQEKVQNQLIQNEQKLKNTNFYNSVSNLAEFEMEQENKQDELMEEDPIPNGTPAVKPGPRSNDNPRRPVNGAGFAPRETYPDPPVSATASCAKPDRPNPQSQS